ncbi:hypothetical protein KFL_001100090 [Klebsormidium nitens]|uniref:SWIM-type domain-containing protein n=1 Tax=Klebsormidium nitens TaxID=105231 RepID=A0A1Y1HUT6_KLENI|nr:hypothetical protein KFL_001100090 [Klebsormidium nitens]|eukprot:GAQ82395.1 hypothetical protein KFL_001100090 [Klebsormidium nitens]
MAARAILLSREAIKKVAGNDGTFKRAIEVQASNKMTEIEFSGEQFIHGKAKCEGSSPRDVYILKFELDPSMPSARPQADCSCPSAQRGLCKHVVALLLTRADQIEAEERLRARERLAAARADATGKAVLAEDLPPPPPLEAPPPVTSAAVEGGPSEVAAVFQPMITNALAAGSALSAAGGAAEASSSRSGKRVLPPWLQPKSAKPEKGKGKGRPSAEGIADIRTLLGKKRPLEVVAKQPPRRRARGAKIVQEDSEEEGGDDEAGGSRGGDVAPRERSTRRAAVAGSRRLREVAEDEEEGGKEDDGMDDEELGRGGKTDAQRQMGGTLGVMEDTGTLGYDWENWGSIVENMRENEQETGAEASAVAQNGRKEPDSLWDGEDEDALPQRSRASSRRGQRVEEMATGRGGTRNRRRAVIEEEDEESAPVEEAGLRRGREGRGPGEESQAHRPQSAQQPNRDAPQPQAPPMTPAQAPDTEPIVPKKKKNSLFSLKNFKDAVRGLTDEEAGQLLSSMAPPQLPVSETPPLEPLFGSLPVPESVGSPTRNGELEQPHVESLPRESSPPPLLSDVVENVPTAATESGAFADVLQKDTDSSALANVLKPLAEAEAGAHEEVPAEPNAPSGEFNPLEAMLSVLNTTGSRAKRRAAKAAANTAAGAPSIAAPTGEVSAREPSALEASASAPAPPAREPLSRETPSQQIPASGERFPQSRAPLVETRRKEAEANVVMESGQPEPSGENGQLESKPRSPSRLPRVGEVGKASMEQTGSVSVAGPLKRKVKFGAMLRPQGELKA